MTDKQFIEQGQEAQDKNDKMANEILVGMRKNLLFLRGYFFNKNQKQNLMKVMDLIEITEGKIL